jgi:hypothetical protein
VASGDPDDRHRGATPAACRPCPPIPLTPACAGPSPGGSDETGAEGFRAEDLAAASARAHVDELLPAVLDDRIEPERVLDRAVGLEDVAMGHQEMAERTDLKVLLQP